MSTNTKENIKQENKPAPISGYEKLAAQKMVADLMNAASSIASAKDWMQTLTDNDWYIEDFGFASAAIGICQQLPECYKALCEAFGIPQDKKSEI